MPQNRLTSGGVLVTPYGLAVFVSYRERDNVYRLKLPYGELYVTGESIVPSKEEESIVASTQDTENSSKSMELNEAYEALEHMRRLNLELTCQKYGIREKIDHDECTVCILERAKSNINNNTGASTFGLKRRSFANRCLTCGSPSCVKHSSDLFLKQGITLCLECEKVFQMDFLMDCVTLDSNARRDRMEHLVDLYDRTHLILMYSEQFFDEVADVLETTKKRHNAFNITGSSAGIVSGVLGIAAALSVLTPAGPPLIVAALLFGGSSTAMQTGTEMKNLYFFEPAKVANRILALHGMVLSILTVTGALRDVALLDHDLYRFLPSDSKVIVELQTKYVPHRDALLAEAEQSEASNAEKSIRVDRYVLAAAAAEAEKRKGSKLGSQVSDKKTVPMVARNARFMSRFSSGVMSAFQFAQFAGGALSIVTILSETRGAARTLKSINAGSPCEKAAALRRIQLLMNNFPQTKDLEKESRAYLAYMNERSSKPMSQDEAAELFLQVAHADDEMVVKLSSKKEHFDSRSMQGHFNGHGTTSFSNRTGSTISTTSSWSSTCKEEGEDEFMRRLVRATGNCK